MTRRRGVLGVVLALLWALPVGAQTVEVVGTTLAVGTSPTSPSGTSVRLDNLGTSGGTLVLFTDTDGDVFERILAASDIPSAFVRRDVAESITLAWTFAAGLTSSGAVQVNSTLGVTGATTLSSTLGVTGEATFTGGALIPDGTVSVPGLRFTSDPNTGLRRSATDTLQIVAGGSDRVTVSSATTTITNAASLSSTLGVTGATTLSSTLGVTDATTLSSTLGVTGATTLSSTLGVTGATTLSSTLGVTGNATLAADLAVNGGDLTSTTALTVRPTGNLLLDPTGDIIMAADGNDILPDAPYEKNLGALSNKYLTLHAAELWVETLVAQDTIATIGGRILVGPTTQLTEDLAAAATTVTVKHNQMSSGDRVYMEADGKVEFMAITSGATGTGGGDSVNRKGAATAAATSVTLPAHVAGDWIVIVAFRVGSTTAPTLGSGFTNVCNGGANSTSYRVGKLQAASAAETSGTWTNATHLHAFVYEGVTDIGACASLDGTATTTLSYPALTLTDADGSSYVLRAGLTNQTADTSGTPPSGGYTLIQNQTGSSRNSSSFESNAGQTSVTQSDVTLGASGNTRGISLELLGTTTPASGPFAYTVTRNLDGTGANDWYAGDALFNTGQSGNGFIDLYSVRGVKSGSEAGPTIVGNVRASSTYNDWAARWAVGNLNGLYGYGTTTYGAAFGNPSDVFLSVDATNGIRMMEGGSTLNAQFALDGSITLGQTGSGQANTIITPTSLKQRRGTVDYVTLDATGLLLGLTTGSEANALITSSGLSLRRGTSAYVDLSATGLQLFDTAATRRVLLDSSGLLLGITTAGNANIFADTSGNLKLRSGTVNRITLDAANGTLGILDDDGTTARFYVSTTDAVFGSASAGRLAYNFALGRLSLYDGAGNLRLWTDSTNGLVLGEGSNASGKPYAQLTNTNLMFCEDGGSCPLVFSGTTGDITSSGNIVLSTGGNVTSTGNWSLTNTTGLSFSASASSGGDATRQVAWAGGSKAYEFGNILTLYGANNTVYSASGFTSVYPSLQIGNTQVVHIPGDLLIGTASNGAHAEILPAVNAFNPASLGSATYQWDNLYLDSPANDAGVNAPDSGFPVYGTGGLLKKYTTGLDMDMTYDYGIYVCTIRIRNGIVTEFLGCV